MAAPTLQEAMDDLCSRFIMNCPKEEHDSFERLFFQIESAHWFYEDNYRIKWPNELPSFGYKHASLLPFAQWHQPVLQLSFSRQLS